MSPNAVTKQTINDLVKYLSAGGNITVAAKAPNLAPYLTTELKRHLRKSTAMALFKRVIRYGRAQALLSAAELPKGRIRLRLTPAGIKRAQKISLDEINIPRPRRWDGRWRLVMFDIPETQRQARNKLTSKLKMLGFYQVQKSAWVYPFPCLIEIEYLKRTYGISSFVSLAEISKIDNHARLVRHFRSILPSQSKKIS